ncbi:Zinc resistance conferring protein [Umbelopsis nana]
MLNDMLSLIIALWAVNVAARTEWESKYSYGWQRAEILGALINGVFLLALCFTLLIDCIERFVNPQVITEPVWVLITGCAGLAANLFGLVLFHGNHSHDARDEVKDLEIQPATIVKEDSHATLPINLPDGTERTGLSGSQRMSDISRLRASVELNSMHPAVARDIIVQQAKYDTSNQYSSQEQGSAHDTSADSQHTLGNEHGHSHQNLNMRGVFLHVLGDALGNIGVIISALIIWLTPYRWRFYSDPLISLIITIIIFSTALPLVRSTSFILLQAVPNTIAIEDVRRELYKTDDVLSVHELHIWQLSDTKMVASLHVLLASTANYMTVAKRVRNIMHKYGIHSITIQPEFVDPEMSEELVKHNQGACAQPNVPAHKRMQPRPWWSKLLPWGKKTEQPVDEETQIESDSDFHISKCLLRCSEDESCAEKMCCPSPAPLTSSSNDSVN